MIYKSPDDDTSLSFDSCAYVWPHLGEPIGVQATIDEFQSIKRIIPSPLNGEDPSPLKTFYDTWISCWVGCDLPVANYVIDKINAVLLQTGMKVSFASDGISLNWTEEPKTFQEHNALLIRALCGYEDFDNSPWCDGWEAPVSL